MPALSAILGPARTRLTAAQAALDAALAAGQPTEKARETLSLAETEVARIESELAAEQAAARQAAADDTEAQARAMVNESVTALQNEMKVLVALDAPTVALPISIAANLVESRARLAEQQAEAGTHAERLTGLRARLAALESDRAAIVTRRAEGDCRPTDGAELALIDADAEGLRSLIARTAAEQPQSDASRAVSDWSAHWQREVASARGIALMHIARELDARLAKVLDAIRMNGTGPWYRPSAELERSLKSL